MKRNILYTMVFLAALLVSLPAMARDHDGYICTAEKVAGTWGYIETGTVILPAAMGGTIPYASVGKYTVDRYGNLTGARTASAAGNILNATIKGTATVKSDCTGTLKVIFYDSEGIPTGSAEKSIVYVNKATEARMILMPGAYPAVLTTDAKKIFPDDAEDNDCRH
jgi:hypothetical protein